MRLVRSSAVLAGLSLLLSAGSLTAQGVRNHLYDKFQFAGSGAVVLFGGTVKVSGDQSSGTEINLHDVLGLSNTKFQPRGAIRWRPGRRHELEIGYQFARRSGEKTLDRNFTFADSTYTAGIKLKTIFNTDQAFLTYRYAVHAGEGTQLGLGLGLGAFFIVGVRSLQASLLTEFSIEAAADAPDMFLMDIQRGQADAVSAFLDSPASGAGAYQLIPVLRARVTGVNGRETSLESYEDVRARGSLAREYTVTYRDRLEPNERVIEGAFWKGPSTDPEVSVEQGLSERVRLNVGDTIRFDILGSVINARVTSIRRVDWKDSRSGGFMFVFRPGALDRAPQTFISPLRGPNTLEARARLQHDLVERFPNVSVIDFHEILETVRDVMSKVTLAIVVVGGLVLASGALILVGAVAMTKFQRVYEAAVFKTLGAPTRTIATMLLLEYGVLGILAGTVGSIGALGLTWGVSRYALDIPWRLFVGEHIGGVAATAVLVAAIGVASSLDVLRNKPLLTLRAE